MTQEQLAQARSGSRLHPFLPNLGKPAISGGGSGAGLGATSGLSLAGLWSTGMADRGWPSSSGLPRANSITGWVAGTAPTMNNSNGPTLSTGAAASGGVPCGALDPAAAAALCPSSTALGVAACNLGLACDAGQSGLGQPLQAAQQAHACGGGVLASGQDCVSGSAAGAADGGEGAVTSAVRAAPGSAPDVSLAEIRKPEAASC
eukprot:gene2862-3154_t